MLGARRGNHSPARLIIKNMILIKHVKIYSRQLDNYPYEYMQRFHLIRELMALSECCYMGIPANIGIPVGNLPDYPENCLTFIL